MHGFLNTLLKLGQKRHLLISILWMAIFMGFILPWMQSKQTEFSGDVGSPDLQFSYEPDELFKMAEAYGEEGRREYVVSRLSFDVVWPIAYTYFNLAAIGFALNKGLLGGRKLKVILFLPILAMVFDFLENTGVIMVMVSYPEKFQWMASFANYATMLKWIFVGLAFGLAAISLILILVLRKR